MEETKPCRLSYLPSVTYRDSGADFLEVSTDQGVSRLPIWGWRPTNPNKPSIAKAFLINSITEKSSEQTQSIYHACYQLFASILTTILMKFGWIGRASIWNSGARARAELETRDGRFGLPADSPLPDARQAAPG